MNTFNRFLIILICLTALCFWLGALLVVWAMPVELRAALQTTALVLRDSTLLFQGVISAFAVSFILVSLLILVGEFSPQAPRVIPLTGASGGNATVSADTVIERVKGAVEQVAGVRSVRPRVRSVRGGVEMDLEVRTEPESHLPTKADEVRQAVRSATEEQLGLRLKDVKVHFQPERGRGIQRPQGEILVPGAATEAAGQDTPPT